MTTLSDKMIRKLKKVAEEINREKHLYFFGVLQHESMPDRWDILVSAKALTPWSADAIDYMADLLTRELTTAEMIQIAEVAVLPCDNEWIVALSRNGPNGTGVVRSLTPLGTDTALVLWPAEDSSQPATASAKH